MVISVKVWNKITHQKRLNAREKEWELFWEGVQNLKNTIGVILFQFPPTFIKNEVNMKRLKALKMILPNEIRFAFEFRDLSWYVPELVNYLEKNNWCLVNMYVCNKSNWMGNIPIEKPILWPNYQTATFCYVRLHGKLGKFRGYYDTNELKEIINYSQGNENFIYFNNSFFGVRGKKCLSEKDKTIYSCSYCNALEFSDFIKNL